MVGALGTGNPVLLRHAHVELPLQCDGLSFMRIGIEVLVQTTLIEEGAGVAQNTVHVQQLMQEHIRRCHVTERHPLHARDACMVELVADGVLPFDEDTYTAALLVFVEVMKAFSPSIT